MPGNRLTEKHETYLETKNKVFDAEHYTIREACNIAFRVDRSGWGSVSQSVTTR